MPVSVSVWVPASLFLIQVSANVPGKAPGDDDPSAWVLAIHEGCLDEVPAFGR